MSNNRIFLIVFVILLGAIGSVSAEWTANWDFSEGTGGIATDNINSIVATLEGFADPNLAWGTANTCKMSDLGYIELNGSSDYLLVPYNANLDPDAGNFVVSFWMYSPEGVGGEILHNGSSGAPLSGKRWAISLSGGAIQFVIDEATSDKTLVGAAVPNLAGNWHHIVCRRVSAGLEIFIDGAIKGAGGSAITGDIVEEGEDFYIGRRGPDESAASFRGRIADIRFYKGDLSTGEIIALAPSSKAPWCPTPEDGADAAASTDLRWESPSDANEFWTYDVYFGTDLDPMNNTPNIGIPDGGDPNIVNGEIGGPLNIGTTYYWQVVANDPNGATDSDPARVSEVWSFTAGVPDPVLVSPTDGTGGYGLELELDWTSDNSSGLIVQHKLTLNNVTDGTSAIAYIPAASDTTNLTNVDLWPVVFYDKDYEWQITELGAGDEVLIEGPVWSFSTFALQCTGFTIWGDITGDCKANIDDLAALSAAWLECGWQLEGGPVPFPDKDPCQP